MSMMQAEIYDAFIAAKVPEDKARAAAEVIAQKPQSDELATKEYIEKRVAELEARIAELEGELKAEIGRLEGKIDSKIAELKGELKAEIAELRVEIAELETRSAQRSNASTRLILIGIAIATTVIVATIGIATTVIIAFIN